MHISLIIPVYNRPNELQALLESVLLQDPKPHEIIVVEDGSENDSREVAERFQHKLNLFYLLQDNAGPGPARNTGAQKAAGEWLIFLDSDCELPANYLSLVMAELRAHPDTGLFGGPDMDRDDFTPVQKAVNYAMTSVLTTGGIRGGKKSADRFYPRSFNLGIRKSVFDSIGGFRNMRFGEDLDLSMRAIKAGHKSRLFRECGVYHRRRTRFRSFFKQVFNSGMARIYLNKLHPGTLKPVHVLPSLFTVYGLIALAGTHFSVTFLYPLLLIMACWFLHALVLTGSVWIAGLSVWACIVQLTGYGSGFIRAWWRMRDGDETSMNYAFRDGFYD